MRKMLLPDVNLWLALVFESHVHHPIARGWFSALTDSDCSFCRLTQQGFLRLSTNPKALGAEAVTLAEAWQLYDSLLSDARVVFSIEPAGIETPWRGYTQRSTYSPKVWSDAYLAAFARVSGFQIVTFDQAFAKYANLNCTVLTL
jgi:toxin-antitoxin system PIN domain toxin